MADKLQGSLDIQFGDRFDGEKARRLVEELKRLRSAVNVLVDEITALENAPPVTLPVHVLATTTGLGPDHSVSGLSAGQVLVAISDTVAAFHALRVGQLAQTDTASVDGATQDSLFQFHNGFWSARYAGPLVGLAPPSVDSVLGWDETSGTIVWRIAGPGIVLNPPDIEVSIPGIVDDSEFVAFFNGM